MTWKVQFNKYKKMTEPGRCHYCCDKNVVRSYMRACEICTSDKNVCPKCLESETKDRIQTKLNEVEQRKHDEETERKMN